MSLYTPVFPSQPHANHLRDVHIFLSNKHDTLSPPSRPSSPLFDRRVQTVKDEIRAVLSGEPSAGKWTRANQLLKLGCVRGRWSVPPSDPRPPGQGADWILPNEESEWFEWEKSRERERQIRGSSNQIASTPSVHRRNSFRSRPPPDVSPGTLRAAKEKVRKWQASVSSEAWSTSSSMDEKKLAARSQSRALGFAVAKPTANAVLGKRGRPPIRGRSVPVRVPNPKTPDASQGPPSTAPAGMTAPNKPSVDDGVPKITDVPETPYLPPSFPEHLETSTPLDPSKIVVRAKPPPILPTQLSTPPPSTPINPPDDRHVDMPPQMDTVQPRKRSRTPSPFGHGVPNALPASPPTKRPRASSHDSTQSIQPNRDPTAPLLTRDATQDPDPDGAALGRPLTPEKSVRLGVAEKVPSPPKSVRSYFSAPDSDSVDSPVNGNLLLESPVSPMLAYAQNASVFLPQMTSTQVRHGSPTADRSSNGIFEMGFRSQFDLERHVDRVSELLEKDVDFDGWLRDARTVETD